MCLSRASKVYDRTVPTFEENFELLTKNPHLSKFSSGIQALSNSDILNHGIRTMAWV